MMVFYNLSCRRLKKRTVICQNVYHRVPETYP